MGHCKSNAKNCPCNRCAKGWWSRRHETREAQDAASEKYQHERGPAARKRRAEERAV
jgi:hypothetical protein